MSDYDDEGDFSDDSEYGLNEDIEFEIPEDSDNVDESFDDKSELSQLIDVDSKLNDYLKSIDNALQEGKIDDYTYALEKLIIKYKAALNYKRFNIDNKEDELKIERIKILKKELEEELLSEKIYEFDFNRKFYNLLNLEYNILLKYESISDDSIKMKDLSIMNWDEKMKELIKSEEKYLRQIASAYKIEWPKKPKNFKNIGEMFEYSIKLSTAEKRAKNFIPGYKINYIERDLYTGQPKWTNETPVSLTITHLKKEFDSITKDKFYISEDHINKLQSDSIRRILRTKSRSEIMSCINDTDIIKSLSYIEKLRNNTVSVMKFRENPESFLKLKEIIGEEAKYYRISESKLLGNFNKTFYDPIESSNNVVVPSSFIPVKSIKIKDKISGIETFIQIQPSEKGSYILTKVKEIKDKNKKKDFTEYLEKGSVVSLSLKPEFFREKQKLIDGQQLDEKYYNIVKPLSDELYDELKILQQPSNKTELIKVYELHVNIPDINNKLIRRYNEFDDYLFDLVNIMKENMMKLENNNFYRSADILHSKIQKIEHYLKTGDDIEAKDIQEYSYPENVEIPNEIKLQREIGINKLKEYIFSFYPNNEELVETLENDIYNHNKKNYINNVDKIIYIFNEFSDTLKNYISAILPFVELINFEIPLIRPKDDLPNYFSNPGETLTYLKSWMPEIDLYLKHKTYLDSIDNNLLMFKKNKNDLSSLEIDEIFFQMIEYENWEKSKIKLITVQIPMNKDPTRVKLNFLKQERNKLMSRRIYRVAKISERLSLRKSLHRIFLNCNLTLSKQEIDKLSNTTETIIYTYSKRPDDYVHYGGLVKDTYKNLCELITDTKQIIPIVTEYIIKEGDVNLINVERLYNNFIFSPPEGINDKNPNLYIDYIKKLRESELEIYRKTLIEDQNKEPTNYKLKLINIISSVIDINKKEKKDMMNLIAYNTYIAPVLTNIIPTIKNGTKIYVPEYYIIGENEYLYGGNFPDFYSTIDGKKNYTSDEIYSLAILLKIDYEEDINIEKLLYLCLERLQRFSTDSKISYPNKVALNFEPTFPERKKYTSFINYTLRPRVGVKDPGEIYPVIKDTYSTMYAVPFKFNENLIPVYNSKLQLPDIKKYNYIEGPAEFEESSDDNIVSSSMYILIEYIDSYGKTRLFREGVNQKYVKKSPKELFDSCNRFTNEINCNDINSYGIDKIKCKYIKNKCVSDQKYDIEKNELINIDINTAVIKNSSGNLDWNRTKLWKEAIKKANNFITQLLLIKKIDEKEINIIAREQKNKLDVYYKNLIQYSIKSNLETIFESPNYLNYKNPIDVSPITFNEDEGEGEEGAIEDIEQREKNILDNINYTNIRLPRIITKNKNLNSNQLISNNKYIVKKDDIETIETYINKDEIYLYFENDKSFKLGEANFKEVNTSVLVEYYNFKILKEDYEFIKNPPQLFEYKLLENEYLFKKTDIIIKKHSKTLYNVPYEYIYTAFTNIKRANEEELQGQEETKVKNIITRQMIYNAMGEVLYGVFQKNDYDMLDTIESFPATKEAKIQSLKYSVNLRKLSNKIYNIIQLSDVINEYNEVLPKVKSDKGEIIKQLEYGILNKDVKLLKKFIKIVLSKKKVEISEEISNLILVAQKTVEEVEELIKNNQDIKTTREKNKEEKEKEKEEKDKEEQKKLPMVNYIVQRRRKK